MLNGKRKAHKIIHPKLNFTHFLLSTVSVEALVMFSNPRGYYGAQMQPQFAVLATAT